MHQYVVYAISNETYNLKKITTTTQCCFWLCCHSMQIKMFCLSGCRIVGKIRFHVRGLYLGSLKKLFLCKRVEAAGTQQKKDEEPV